jgi:hypothetical protein
MEIIVNTPPETETTLRLDQIPNRTAFTGKWGAYELVGFKIGDNIAFIDMKGNVNWLSIRDTKITNYRQVAVDSITVTPIG